MWMPGLSIRALHRGDSVKCDSSPHLDWLTSSVSYSNEGSGASAKRSHSVMTAAEAFSGPPEAVTRARSAAAASSAAIDVRCGEHAGPRPVRDPRKMWMRIDRSDSMTTLDVNVAGGCT